MKKFLFSFFVCFLMFFSFNSSLAYEGQDLTYSELQSSLNVIAPDITNPTFFYSYAKSNITNDVIIDNIIVFPTNDIPSFNTSDLYDGKAIFQFIDNPLPGIFGTSYYKYVNSQFMFVSSDQGIPVSGTNFYPDIQFSELYLNNLSFLDTLNPSPGFNEYIIYETEWGSTYAEYYRTFPQVTFVSDSDTSDDFQKWKINGNGDREVYYFFDLDPPYWELWDKSYNTEFTGYSTSAEIKIISSSQELSDNANNTYGGYPNGNIEDAPLPTYQEDEVFVNITSPKNGIETVKTSTILEVYYNAPSEYKPDGFFQDTKYATVPEVWLKSNYINNPNNNNGYLPYLPSNIYYAQNDIDYDSASQNNNGDYTLLGVTSKYTGQGRTEYILRMQVNLGVNINDFTVTVKPTFIDFDSGLTSSKYQMDNIVKNFSVTRLTSIDTNNDGIDDTTGEDINNSDPYDGSIINDTGSTPIVSDGNFSQLDSLDIETGLLDIFTNITNFISVYTSSIGQMFTFLPPQIISIIVFSLSVGALIGFFKLIRG